jgi:hypothetical protein
MAPIGAFTRPQNENANNDTTARDAETHLLHVVKFVDDV